MNRSDVLDAIKVLSVTAQHAFAGACLTQAVTVARQNGHEIPSIMHRALKAKHEWNEGKIPDSELDALRKEAKREELESMYVEDKDGKRDVRMMLCAGAQRMCGPSAYYAAAFSFFYLAAIYNIIYKDDSAANAWAEQQFSKKGN